MDVKYIVNIKGKKFVTYNGLLDAAHKKGLDDMRVTELNVNWEKKTAYCVVACKLGELEFMGVGSGTQENCGSMVKNHFVEMAHTRAKARALRDALNVDMVAVDELGEVQEDTKTNSELVCTKCKKAVNQKVADYSDDNYGKILCFDCQKEEKPKEK